MKKIFITDIKQGERVRDTFLVSKKETGVSKTGKPYLSLRFCDNTGELEARVWDDAEAIGANFDLNDVVKVTAHATSYRGMVQLNVTSVTKSAPGEYKIGDYLPASERDADEMMAEVDLAVSQMTDTHLRALLTAMLSDPDLRPRFMLAPAAKAMHHPFISGLLEHVASLCKLGELVCSHYKKLNKDLLTAGLILHDIGKIYELSYDRSIGYTDEGRLIGHITIGVELIDDWIKKTPEFPDKLAMLLKHMILSHHGILEYGSPKRPKTLEALVLHFLDDMDAKVNTFETLIYGDSGQGDWSDYQRLLERYVYKGRYEPQAGSGAAPVAPLNPDDAPAPEFGPDTEKSAKTGEDMKLF